jgi:hypothetical protein
MSAAPSSTDPGVKEGRQKKRARALVLLIPLCLTLGVCPWYGRAQMRLDLAVFAGSPTAPCAAPNYGCARTDTAVIPLDTLSNWGGLKGAGTIFTDPSFNPSYPPNYVRVTDNDTGPNHGFSVGDGNGDDAHFDIDDSLLWLANDGNAIFVFGLIPATMQVGLVSQLPPETYCCNGQWSQLNRNYFYTMTRDDKLWRLDFTGLSIASPGAPTASLVYDFGANCGARGVSLQNFGGMGGGDTVFTATFGQRETGTKVAAYNSSIGKCYLYDTSAGTVTQYPGGTSLGSVTSKDRFTIHGAHGYGEGNWMLVTRGGTNCPTCAIYHAWQIGTTTVNNCVTWCSGHWTETASGWFNDDQAGGIHGPSMIFRTSGNFSASTMVQLNTGNASIDALLETHPTTKNDPLGTHDYPVFASTNAPSTAKAYSNEIVAWTQTPGKVLRFGHTFSSGHSTNFQAQIAVGAVSSTGQFYAFTTDGEGTLGNTDGVHSACVLSAGNCRSDVFILNLSGNSVTVRPPSSSPNQK